MAPTLGPVVGGKCFARRRIGRAGRAHGRSLCNETGHLGPQQVSRSLLTLQLTYIAIQPLSGAASEPAPTVHLPL